MHPVAAVALGATASPALIPSIPANENPHFQDPAIPVQPDVPAEAPVLTELIRDLRRSAPDMSAGIAWDSLRTACTLLREPGDRMESLSLDDSLFALLDEALVHGTLDGCTPAAWIQIARAPLETASRQSLLHHLVLRKCARSLGHPLVQRLLADARAPRGLPAVTDAHGNNFVHLGVLSEDSSCLEAVVRWASSPAELQELLEGENNEGKRPLDLLPGVERTIRPAVRSALKEAYTHAETPFTPPTRKTSAGAQWEAAAANSDPMAAALAEHGLDVVGHRSHGAMWQLVEKLKKPPAFRGKVLMRHDKTAHHLLEVAAKHFPMEGMRPDTWEALATTILDPSRGRTLPQEMVAQGCLMALAHPISKRLLDAVCHSRGGVGNVLDANRNNLVHLFVLSESPHTLPAICQYTSVDDFARMLVAKNGDELTPLDLAHTLKRNARVVAVKMLKQMVVCGRPS